MLIKILICTVFLVIINISDIKKFKIKNKFVLITIIFGLIYGLICKSFLDSIYGLLIPLVLFPLYALKMLGAGDIKALCALGAVLGFKLSIMTMLMTFVSGGVIAFFFMLFNKNFSVRFNNLVNYLKSVFLTGKIERYNYGGGEKSFFSFSYAITVGTILAVFNYYFCII